MITQQGFDNQLRTLEQTNILQNGLNQGLANNREQATSQFNILSAKLDAQTVMINDKFCQLEMREMQNTIAQLREEKAALTASALSQQQTQNIVGQLRPTAVPATPLVLLTRLILGDRYSEEVATITDVDVTTDVAITTLLSDFIKKGC